jgi:hypothetical protein
MRIGLSLVIVVNIFVVGREPVDVPVADSLYEFSLRVVFALIS